MCVGGRKLRNYYSKDILKILSPKVIGNHETKEQQRLSLVIDPGPRVDFKVYTVAKNSIPYAMKNQSFFSYLVLRVLVFLPLDEAYAIANGEEREYRNISLFTVANN